MPGWEAGKAITPEESARREIDYRLDACGWPVQDVAGMNIRASLGVAVREFPLKRGHGFADYLLYADGRAIGVVEAKPEGFTLKGVETQSAKYLEGLPDLVPTHRLPLPMSYESTGTVTQFTNALEPDARSREVFAFHRPEELLRLIRLKQQVRERLREMPPLAEEGLWPAQIEAINNLERSLSENRPRSLVQMTMGSGKTFTSVASVYRLVKFAGAKRVLFLVDRRNLGTQTLNEFRQYISPHTNRAFTDEYNVQHLRSNTVDPASRVVITTVQRLYSILKGEDHYEEEAEEHSMFETDARLAREPLPVVYNPRIPLEAFDFIVVDECHRSIYNLWRQVLEYFDAYLVGLTATPSKQTIGFFGGNLVMQYGHEQAVADAVNVGFDVYRIRTQVTEGGATLEKEPDFFVPRRDRRTRARRYAALDDDLTYTANQLDRDVVAENQIRLVVRTFKERLPAEIFPGRTEVPKTLVFAKDDAHADDITRIMREEFAKGNDFCQKITYRTTGKKPEELLQEFRNSYNPRMAVTVDMIATGTDVKPLECLLFMRNVRSANYFEQMKGRGSRVINRDDLKSVTPDAEAKTRFVIVDAVGVSEEDRAEAQPLERQPSVSFDRVMQAVAMGNEHPDVVSTLASRLTRLERKLGPEQHEEISQAAGGNTLRSLAATLVRSLDPDAQADRAAKEAGLVPGEEPTEEQLDAAERAMISEALAPFHDPQLRTRILDVQKAFEQVIDETTPDQLLAAGFDEAAREKARTVVDGFERFIEENRDEIEALKLLYSRPRHAGLRYAQVKDLAQAIKRPPLGATPELVWKAYEALEPSSVRGGATGGKKLADVISLVRHAMDPAEPLEPYAATVEERYTAWMGEQEAAGATFTPEQRRWLDAIRDHVATALRIERDDFDDPPLRPTSARRPSRSRRRGRTSLCSGTARGRRTSGSSRTPRGALRCRRWWGWRGWRWRGLSWWCRESCAAAGCEGGRGAVVRRAYLAAVVRAILMGCVLLVSVSCAGVRSEAPKLEQQERTEATRAKGRSPEATATEEAARCGGTRTFQTGGGPFTTNDLPGCPRGGLLLGTEKADKLDGKDGDDELRSLGGADGLIIGGPGNDVIYGGPGDDDPLWGAEGNDVVYGGDGDDGLEDVGGGADVFYGGDGDDDITAWADGQRDEIHCGKGKDSYVADKHDYVSSDCEKKQEVTTIY